MSKDSKDDLQWIKRGTPILHTLPDGTEVVVRPRFSSLEAFLAFLGAKSQGLASSADLPPLAYEEAATAKPIEELDTGDFARARRTPARATPTEAEELALYEWHQDRFGHYPWQPRPPVLSGADDADLDGKPPF